MNTLSNAADFWSAYKYIDMPECNQIRMFRVKAHSPIQIVHIYLEASGGHLNPIVLLFQIEKEIFNVIWRMSLSLQTEKKKIAELLQQIF